MSNIIEELFYGNIELQELTTEIILILKNKLSELVKKGRINIYILSFHNYLI